MEDPVCSIGLGNTLPTVSHMYWFGGFEHFVNSGFEREPLMLDKQMIPHFKGLNVGFKISQEQLCSFIRNDHATFLVKNTLFTISGRGKPLIMPIPCPSRI